MHPALAIIAFLAAGVVFSAAVRAEPVRPTAAQHTFVGINLVTALDVSASVTPLEQVRQLNGMAAAITDPSFLRHVQVVGRVGFAAYTWSHAKPPRLIVPWTLIAFPQDAERVADMIMRTEIGYPRRRTDASMALHHAVALHRDAPFVARRAAINLITDDIPNAGPSPAAARDIAVARGITVNAMVFGNEPGVARYVHAHVIGGFGAFLLRVDEERDFADAIRRKFSLDIALAGLSARPLSSWPPRTARPPQAQLSARARWWRAGL